MTKLVDRHCKGCDYSYVVIISDTVTEENSNIVEKVIRTIKGDIPFELIENPNLIPLNGEERKSKTFIGDIICPKCGLWQNDNKSEKKLKNTYKEMAKK